MKAEELCLSDERVWALSPRRVANAIGEMAMCLPTCLTSGAETSKPWLTRRGKSMTYVEQQDKRLCAPNGCTAKSFFGLSAVLNQKAKAYLSSKPQGITFKIKIERLTRRAALALRGLFAILGRFAKPQHAPELHS